METLHWQNYESLSKVSVSLPTGHISALSRENCLRLFAPLFFSDRTGEEPGGAGRLDRWLANEKRRPVLGRMTQARGLAASSTHADERRSPRAFLELSKLTGGNSLSARVRIDVKRTGDDRTGGRPTVPQSRPTGDRLIERALVSFPYTRHTTKNPLSQPRGPTFSWRYSHKSRRTRSRLPSRSALERAP